MDTPFFSDLRPPFIMTDIPAVTLAATDKALYPLANFPLMGGNYWWVGKKVQIRLFGRMTTGATPGNLTVSVYWGTGADANGTVIVSSAAKALTINAANLSWEMLFRIHCRSYGATGTLFCTGSSEFNVGLIASTIAPILFPDSAPVVSGSLDLTAANILSVQAKRTGSTAESMQVHDMEVQPLN